MVHSGRSSTTKLEDQATGMTHILLEKLRNLLDSIPSFEGRGSYSPEQFSWLGRANAAMHEWSEIQSIPFKSAVHGLLHNIDRQGNYGAAMAHLYDAISRLESSLPQQEGQAFGPGAVYDFFKALNELVASARNGVLIADPYLDAEVFDGYLSALRPGTSARLITTKYVDAVRVAATKYQTQFGSPVELRRSTEIHDRVIFVDNDQCWVLGASIKDAAQKKPTYLAPLSLDVAVEKRKQYEAIWVAGTPI